MVYNVIPFIGGEEEKSENEPLKIWGHIENGQIVNASTPSITSQCLRVPVSDGHTAAVFASFEKKAEMEEIIARWENYKGEPQKTGLPCTTSARMTGRSPGWIGIWKTEWLYPSAVCAQIHNTT